MDNLKRYKSRGEGGGEKRWLGTAGNPALKPFSKGIMQLNSTASTTGESVLYWASWKGCSSVHRKLAWNKSYCWKGTLFSLQVALQNYVIVQCSPIWSCTFPMTSRKLSTCISSISILGNPVATFDMWSESIKTTVEMKSHWRRNSGYIDQKQLSCSGLYPVIAASINLGIRER